jgi:alkaline phosphatase D
MSVGRREFIIGSVGVAASSQLLGGCGDDSGDKGTVGPDSGMPGEQVNTALFAHGVASGDPLADAVILWTRVSVVDGANVELGWLVSKDPLLTSPVKSGTVAATVDADFTAKIDVTGLEAGTTYYYAFTVAGRGRSVTGRTRTLPTHLEHARIAFTSCANYQNGYFSAYRALAARNDLDVWLHLGDYIYEYKAGEYADAALAAARSHLPAKEAVTLADYRSRYAQYRADPDLLALHRQHPLIAVWDDHEFANNAYVGGAENHNPDQGEGDWTERKRAASRAFREWLPIRVVDADPVPKIFRSFKFGELFDLIMLDTRILARDKQTGNDSTFGDVGTDPAAWADPKRHIIGAEQEAWLLNELTQSSARGARWRLIGNQVIFSQGRNPLDSMDPHGIIYSDFWDGYQADRNGIIDGILQGGIKNVVFLTGDIHSSWAFEISKNPFDSNVYNPAAGLNGFAIELVGPSVTSLALENDPGNAMAAPALLPTVNPHLRFSEFTRKGYVLLDVTNERLQAEWWYVVQFKAPNDATEMLGKAFTCQQSSALLVETTAPTPPKDAPPLIA